MELIRRNSDYAFRALSFMAKYPQGKRLTIHTIAAKQGIPTEFLKKIFQRLSSHKIVNAKTGPDGGYCLTRNPSKISMKEVIESVQGRVSLNDCLIKKNLCGRQESCQIRKKLFNIQQELEALLSKSNLGEMS